MKYRPEIDGLRALAVIPVILFHAGFEYFNGGYIGVDIFFVISGYLITSIIIKEQEADNFSLLSFYERRARRILPALFLVIFISSIFAWFLLSPADLKNFGQSLFAAATFSSNILFWIESGYFDTAVELKPLIHTWSLAVEEQYYLIFPIFMILFWKLGIKTITYILIIVFVLSLLGAQLISSFDLYSDLSSASFYLLPTRIWELLIGVFSAIYLKNNNFFKSVRINNVLSILGVSLIIFAITSFNKSTPFPSLYTLIPTIGTMLLITSVNPKTILYKFFSWSPLVGVGLISYSAYLWHQPILAYARHIKMDGLSDLIILVLCASSVGLAYLSWRFVEKPFRDKQITTSKFIAYFSSIGILFFIAIGSYFHFSNGASHRVIFKQSLVDSFMPINYEDCFSVEFNHYAENWGCSIGAEKEHYDLVFFGDSHSLSLKNLIADLAFKNNLSVFYTGANGCLPFLGVFPDRNDQYKYNCNLLNERVYKFIQENKIKNLFLSARWSYYNTPGEYDRFDHQYIAENPRGPFDLNSSRITFKNTLKKTIAKYQKLGVKINIISQPPHQYRNPETLYFLSQLRNVGIDSLSVRKNDFLELEQESHKTFLEEGIKINYIYLAKIFCDQQVCNVGNKDRSYYYDDDHLNDYGAKKLENLFQESLPSIIN